MLNQDEIKKGCQNLVIRCANLKSTEKALVISDETTRQVGEIIATTAREMTSQVSHLIIPPSLIHGQEPPANLPPQMCQSDVIFGVTQMSMAHTQARFAASKAGARYLSLPDYSLALLARPAMQVDFRSLTQQANKLANKLTLGQQVHLKTQKGTNLTCNITARTANAAPGWCQGAGTLASPPDAEVNIAVIENASSGIAVIDGSIPCKEIGLLSSPLVLTIENGQVIDIEGQHKDTLWALFNTLGTPKTRIVAEFGIGLNPLAELRGSMLEDEGCLGTVHLGMGSNATVGGVNQVSFHLDHVIRQATVEIDGHPILQNGQFI